MIQRQLEECFEGLLAIRRHGTQNLLGVLAQHALCCNFGLGRNLTEGFIHRGDIRFRIQKGRVESTFERFNLSRGATATKFLNETSLSLVHGVHYGTVHFNSRKSCDLKLNLDQPARLPILKPHCLIVNVSI